MDKNTVMQSIRNVMTRVLEDASFVFTDDLPPDARDGVSAGEILGVSLAFKGERTGAFRLWGTPGFAALLVANMTGIDDHNPSAGEKGIDAMKEILNIIAGNALTEIYGTTAVFELGIPETTEVDRFVTDRSRDDALWLLSEEHPLLCVADLEP
jgi:CheY-specific phosphatase CheX